MRQALILAALLVISGTSVRAQTVPEPAAPIHLNKIILVGDSTMAVHSGWGYAFCAEHTIQTLSCLNLARGGRSTKSYRAEGSWRVALAEAKTPGYDKVYVLIQLGHNDQPGKPGRSTDLKTEYPDNLRLYVHEAREAGAIPVLITPITRRLFKDGVLMDDLGPWVVTVRAVAAEMKVPLVDLNQRSRALVTALGPVGSLALAQTEASAEMTVAALNGTSAEALPPLSTTPPTAPQISKSAHYKTAFDNTHLGPLGAKLAAAEVAQDLIHVVPELATGIVP